MLLFFLFFSLMLFKKYYFKGNIGKMERHHPELWGFEIPDLDSVMSQ